MNTPTFSRRAFVKGGSLAALATPLLAGTALAGPRQTPDTSATGVALHWLSGKRPAAFAGVTWGTPWPRGQVAAGSGFELSDSHGHAFDLQSWPLAYWPDGSLKWSGHALAAHDATDVQYILQPVAQPAAAGKPLVTESATALVLDTGPLRCVIPRQGSQLISEIRRQGQPALLGGELLLRVQGDPDQPVQETRHYRSEVREAVVEQHGPVRAVIALRGVHSAADGHSLLPFSVRLYAYAGSSALRLLHSIVYDGNEQEDFIQGLGLSFQVPLQAPLHDRHVRFVGANGGLFGEAVRGLSGLRRDPGEGVIAAQRAGRATPPLAEPVASGLGYIPAFGSYRLLQAHPDGFSIAKRTASGQGWIQAASGERAAGVGYLGAPNGGVVFGIRNFWQSYPGQLDIEDAHTEQARVTLWLWAPQAQPMDLRFYHDGLGQDSHAKQREALDITYEDYEPGFGSPLGVARTSELELQFIAATPSSERLLAIAERIQEPPLLLASPERLHAAGVFGPAWSPRRAGEEALESQLSWYFEFYRDEVEQRRWYGFWDYGDVMHTYDGDRHVWRYDVGGYAWDNSELSTDLWLWYYFLRSGRRDVFRMAEAMTRHTGEVDVHHIGPFAPLGSRHNVRHWGDSAKQLRVSTAANRRFLYYLTADERTGDLLRAQNEALRTLQRVVPARKIGQQAAADPQQVNLFFGIDWGAVAAAWLTEWERTGDDAIRQRLLNGMRSIAAQPHGFFSGSADLHIDSGSFQRNDSGQLYVLHLSAVFGLAEICGELLQLLPEPAFERAWLDYCRLYNATPEQQRQALGQPLPKTNLKQAHARLSAFAGYWHHDPALQARAWAEFHAGEGGIPRPNQRMREIAVPAYLHPVREAEPVSVIDQRSGSTHDANLSTNAVAQWGLTAIALLALAGPAR
ncbi:Tat pathway signal sequence domain protein [Stutzerimonas kirkiae]|uniref:exo-rhamnogalacturonan lyase family protein n=1 Tax=Stutzerimonas kirkiae TaxID=2211392 RepID=UPI001038562D|nr:Tat pathway signal sequence domain protein [Stutzerimonas kirkiae]TBV12789.1 Tat pathway signal sequence domain protein [Stutzerimonas kirkiae]